MAIAPAFLDEWPTTSLGRQHPFHSLSVARNQPSNSRLSYAEIANGKRTVFSKVQNDQLTEAPYTSATSGAASVSSFSSLSTDPAAGSPAPPTHCPPGGCVPGTASDISTAVNTTSVTAQFVTSSPVREGDANVNYTVEDAWQTAVENLERANVIREKIGLIVNHRYKIAQKISFGSYGAIYSAVDLQMNRDVAVKFETGAKQSTDMHLKYENDVYHDIKGAPGVPAIYWFGSEYEHQILVMQLLGPSLEQLFNFCERQFSCETIVSLGEQMVQRIRNLHNRGFLHRDIKPENFLMGLGEEENVCFLVDFGLARRYRYRDGGNLTHIPFRKGKNLVGTAKYASLNSHNGLELSRRDDLESLGYIIIEFINRELPWKEQRSKARFRTKQQSYNRIRNIKEQADWSIICPKMAEWIRYCRQLGFSDDPDYDFLISLLRALLSADKNTSDGDSNMDISQQSEASCSFLTPGMNSTCRQPHEPLFSSPIRRRNESQHYAGNQWSQMTPSVTMQVPRGVGCLPPDGLMGPFVRPSRWPSTSVPHPRAVRPAHQHVFNPGGGFAFPPPTVPPHRFAINGSRCLPHSSKSGFEDHGSVRQPQPMGSFNRPYTSNVPGVISVDGSQERVFDDGTKRYSWLMRRDSSPNQRYTFECLFRWTVPSGRDPASPPVRRISGCSFGYGGNNNHFSHPKSRSRWRGK